MQGEASQNLRLVALYTPCLPHIPSVRLLPPFKEQFEMI